eukprot:TRINITY_DN763_c1_g1_i1.p1 TRINITY_DN763_c1_g1~~TRINITY_DN763_c1_g1_i1.p1  ORF type:complete len:100 (+),score=0.35 TRINITY_DN763_c1_g1_i1:512-811(+)
MRLDHITHDEIRAAGLTVGKNVFHSSKEKKWSGYSGLTVGVTFVQRDFATSCSFWSSLCISRSDVFPVVSGGETRQKQQGQPLWCALSCLALGASFHNN